MQGPRHDMPKVGMRKVVNEDLLAFFNWETGMLI